MKKLTEWFLNAIIILALAFSTTTAAKAESSSAEDETYLVVAYHEEILEKDDRIVMEVGEEETLYALIQRNVKNSLVFEDVYDVTWNCSNSIIAEINARTGVIKGKEPGTGIISAVYQGKTAQYELNIIPAEPTLEDLSGICFFRYIPGPVFTMKSPTGSLSIDTTGIIPEMEAKNIEFSVENEEVATISSTEYSDVGIKYVNLVFKRAGSTKVHAKLTYMGKLYEDVYDLYIYESRFSLKLTPPEEPIEVGEKLQMEASCRQNGSSMLPWELDPKDVNWKSSNDNIVRVEKGGKLTAVGQGTASVTGSYKIDGEVVSTSCEIVVKETANSKVEETKTSEPVSSTVEESKSREHESSTVEESKPREHESSTVEESKPREQESSKVGENSAKEQESSKAEETKTSEPVSSTVEESKPSEQESSKVEETKTSEPVSSTVEESKPRKQESSKAVESKASEHESSTVEESKPREHESSKVGENSAKEQESSTVEVFKTSESELTIIILSLVIVSFAIAFATIIVKARKR